MTALTEIIEDSPEFMHCLKLRGITMRIENFKNKVEDEA